MEPEPSNAPSRLLRFAHLALRAIFGALVLAFVALTLVWGLIHGWIVPRIEEFRPQLEQLAGRAVGTPVRVGQLRAHSVGLVPSFELLDVVLLDAGRREALRLPRVVFSLSFRSVLSLGFDQLFIDAPELEVRRGADGRLFVGGLEVHGSASPDSDTADWFFSQHEFVIRSGTLRWHDEQRGAQPLALSQVDLVLRNRARRHEIRLDATPPPGWGQRFFAVAQFRRPLWSRHAGRWADWSGQFYAEFAHVDVSQLNRHADFGVQVHEGQGALRAWVDVDHGVLQGGTVDLAVPQMRATLGAGLEPLALRSVRGRVGGQRLASGFRFFTEGLQFDTAEGLHWPGGNVYLSHTAAEGRTPATGEFRADRLDLAALSQIASRIPLSDTARDLLRQYQIEGLVDTLQASWQGALSDPQRYEARGRVSRLAFLGRPGLSAGRAQPGWPGVAGATIDFDLTQSGGKGKLAISRGALEFPGVFEEPRIPLDDVQAEAQWQNQDERISVNLARLKLSSADVEGEFKGNWRTAEVRPGGARSRFPGVIDLQGSFTRATGARVYRYLPLAIPQDVRHYVRDAVLTGTATNVAVRVRGDLNDLPFADPRKGEFRFAGKVQGVTLAYVPRRLQRSEEPAWPALTALSGELVFDRASMRVNGARSEVLGAPGLSFPKVEAQIPNLMNDTTVLVSGEAKGPLGSALQIVNGSPISELIGRALAQASASGDAGYRLKLTLPIHHIERSRVEGSVALAGNELRITSDTPALSRARGTVTFSENGFAITGGQARMLGGDARIEGGSRSVAAGRNDPSVVLRAQGQVSAEGLRAAQELGFLSRIGAAASGSTAYSATLAFRRGHPEFSLSSSLQGLALNLPAPLSKTAEAAMPLRFENLLQRESLQPDATGVTRPRDQMTLEVGRLMSMSYVRDLSDPQARVLRGAIGVGLAPGESAPMPADGVMANINLGLADVDAWTAVLSKAAGAPLVAQGDAPGAVPAASGYLPTVLALRARELVVQKRTLRDVVVGGVRDGPTWRATLAAQELNGYIEYRQAGASGPGRLHARLARLAVGPAAVTEVESLLDAQPATIPALDIVIDDTELQGRKLGRIEVEAVNRGGDSGAREWRLNRLGVTVPEASFQASGNWTAVGTSAVGPRERRRTVLNYRLDISDAGQLLARFGMKDVLRRGRGRLDGQVAWVGSPLSIDYPSLGGQIALNLESGQFLKADPGLAKLLGVLSLQSLPRRLTLDFRDVFSEGFAFDFVRGDAVIANGVATTNNLQMKGVNAAVLMDGKADILHETQDLRVIIVPEIDAGTASLVATAINPAIGLGTFLAQLLLRRPLTLANTQEFHIDGTWADPRITKVERKPGAAAPAAPVASQAGGTP